MSDLLQIVSRLEQAGGKLYLDGNRITYTIPKGSQEAHKLLSQLREHRHRVVELLRNHEAVCWHCGGECRCACSTCGLEERGRAAGPCAVCRGTGKVRIQ